MDELTAQVSSTLNELTREFNIITHNLANVSTVGYKRRCNAFSKSLMAQEPAAGASGEVSLNTTFDFSQGEVVRTGRSLDFTLCGKGFFVVETPQGPLYTRNGIFHLNQNGQIVDSAGRIISGQSGPISIPPDTELSQISVSSDGNISAGGASVGKFKLVDFGDGESELVAVGTSCFQAPENISAVEAENLIVKQGFQESSNVRMVEELVDMMMVSRLYEANMKFVSAKMDTSQSIIGVAMA